MSSLCGWNDLDLLREALERRGGRGRHHGADDGEWRSRRAPTGLSRGRAISAASTARSSSAMRSSPASGSGCTGAQARFGVTADLAIYAKAVAAGFPLALVAGRRDVMDTLLDKGVMHGGTYTATSRAWRRPWPPSTCSRRTTAPSIATSNGAARA